MSADIHSLHLTPKPSFSSTSSK
uniref:Uncharacterized protein n=1 Tax=Arundo donax TaxID=35708 RepID=A0A0A9S5D3_ARUDO